MTMMIWLSVISLFLSFFIVIGKYEKFSDTFISPIPKFIHRLHMEIDPNQPSIIEKNQFADKNLKQLHPGWTFLEWNSKKIMSFITKNYRGLVSTYTSLENPIIQQDYARYIILRHFGGVFIRNNVNIVRNIAPLLGESELVLFYRFEPESMKDTLNNNFMAAVPQHKFFEFVLLNFMKLADDYQDGSQSLTALFSIYLKQFNQDVTITALSNKYLTPYVITDNLPANIQENCLVLANTQQCAFIFPQAYGFELWDLGTNEKSLKTSSILEANEVMNTYFAFDKMLVVNMKRSPDRWTRIAKEMFDNDMKFERFEAMDGYHVKIKDFKTNKIYYGIDMKRKIYKFGFHEPHEITCKGRYNTVSFRLQAEAAAIIAGNLGVWCSKVLIRDLISKYRWNHTVVFEDDFYPNWNNFQNEVNRFIEKIPVHYDQGFLDSPMVFYKKLKNKVNDYIYYMPPTSNFYGDWAYMLSLKGARKLNAGFQFRGNSDEYVRYLARGLIRPNVTYHAFSSVHNFSAKSLFAYDGRSGLSISSAMGCRTNQTTITTDCDDRVHLDQAYIIVKNEQMDSNLFSLIEKIEGISDVKNIRLVSLSESKDLQIVEVQRSFKNTNGGSSLSPTDLVLHQSYTLLCNPQDIHIFQFSFIVQNRDLFHEELQRWCTLYRIWRDARSNNYGNILVVDEQLGTIGNLTERLDAFLSVLPVTYDVALLNKPKIIRENRRIQEFNEGLIDKKIMSRLFLDAAPYFGAPRAAIYSHKAIHTFLASAKKFASPSASFLSSSFFGCIRDQVQVLDKQDLRNRCKITLEMKLFAAFQPLFE